MSEQANILSFDEVKSHRVSRRRSNTSQTRRNSSFSQSSTAHTAYTAHNNGLRVSRSNTFDRKRVAGAVARDIPSRRAQQLQASRATHPGDSRKKGSSSISPRRNAYTSRTTYSRGGSARSLSQSQSNQTSRGAAEDLTFMQGIKKRARSIKAEREFNKTIGSERPSAQGATSRAALYNMRMGRTQKRSTKMQQGSSNKNASSSKVQGSLFSRFASWASPAIMSRLVIAGCCVLFTFVMLYQPLADYYGEARQLQKLEAEYSALEEKNASLQSEIDYLSTDEGLEDYARYKLGYVRADEQTATVENVASSTTNTEENETIFYSIPQGTISAPDTWYSGVLDVVFGYGK